MIDRKVCSRLTRALHSPILIASPTSIEVLFVKITYNPSLNSTYGKRCNTGLLWIAARRADIESLQNRPHVMVHRNYKVAADSFAAMSSAAPSSSPRSSSSSASASLSSREPSTPSLPAAVNTACISSTKLVGIVSRVVFPAQLTFVT